MVKGEVIDIDNSSHYFAVPPDRDDRSVREFPTLTAELNVPADCLKACRVVIVAMESAGVF